VVRTAAASTRQEALYLDIRARLLRGEFSPGQPIRTDELCAGYEASVSLVREVLTRLAAQRLVTSEANKGFSVTPISAEQITDLCLARSELEALTIRLAIERGDIEWEASVVATRHRLANTARASISDDPETNEHWSSVHSEFHSVLAAGCGSPRLCAIRQEFYDEAEIFRQYAQLYGNARDVEAEHTAIADAIVRRDAVVAEKLIREHIDLTAQATLAAWSRQNPPGAAPDPVRT
jgi:DNA-binding GntR family transcriptional regulator